MTPYRLEAKQLSNAVVAANYRDLHEQGDWASLYAWHQLVKLFADTAEPGTLRVGVDTRAGDRLTRFIALHLRCTEEKAIAVLMALMDARLLDVIDEDLCLPVSPTGWKDPGGRPRQSEGESAKTAKARRRLEYERERAAKRAQGNLLHVITGGLAAAASGKTSPEPHPETTPETGGSFEAVFRVETPVETGAVSPRASQGLSTAAAATGDSRTLKESTTSAAAAESRLARGQASGPIPGGVSGQVSEPIPGRVSGEVSGPVSPEPSGPVVSREAEQVAGRVLGTYKVSNDVAPQLAPFVQGYMDEALSPEEIWAALSGGRQDGDKIHSVSWFRRKLDPLLERKRLLVTTSGDFASRNTEVAADAPPSQVLHPAVAANPAWAGQLRPIRVSLSRLLHAWDLPADHQFRPGKLKLAREGCEPAWQLFVAAYPEAWEAIGEEPPLTAATGGRTEPVLGPAAGRTRGSAAG